MLYKKVGNRGSTWSSFVLFLMLAVLGAWFAETPTQTLVLSIVAVVSSVLLDRLYLKYQYSIFSMLRFLVPVLVFSSLGNRNGVIRFSDLMFAAGVFGSLLHLYLWAYESQGR